MKSASKIDPTKAATPKYAAIPSDPKAHHGPGRCFNNPWESFYNYTPLQFLGLIKEYDRGRTAMPEKLTVQVRSHDEMDWSAINNPPTDGTIQATWLGHASFLIQMGGRRILCDPICTYRCSPFSWLGPARYTPAPLNHDQLRALKADIVILSHNHYDHTSSETLQALGPEITYLVPLGLKSFFASFKYPDVYEMDWWDSREVRGLKVTCTPCQHFTGRGILDRFKTLWSSWVIEGPQTEKFYFAGDTGYRHVPNGKKQEDMPCCPAFKQIGDKFGSIDLACIPIGAYSPRQWMSPVHCSPADSVQVHRDIRSKMSIGMHWGTFVLTDEPLNEPPAKLREEAAAIGLADDAFIVCDIGDTVRSKPVAR